MFYDTLSDCTFDMGCARSNYHGLFRSFAADHGDLDNYVIAGSIPDVVRRYTWLTGKPALLPRWALGYSGSTMNYTDRSDAQAAMADFLAKCEGHDILCDSFHLSSGYTSIGGKRYVFHWNRDKFPDPAAFVRSYAQKGVRLIPNVKPALLHDHPLFAEARDKGLLIADADGAPEWVQFWGAVGAYVDFTNPAALAWWQEKVTTALLDVGMAGTWNDNNEFEIVSPRPWAHGFGRRAPPSNPSRSRRSDDPRLVRRPARACARQASVPRQPQRRRGPCSATSRPGRATISRAGRR
ncbi:MAG: TIM-barrel domain-containing protein [Rhizomicrobium sp.]